MRVDVREVPLGPLHAGAATAVPEALEAAALPGDSEPSESCSGEADAGRFRSTIFNFRPACSRVITDSYCCAFAED